MAEDPKEYPKASRWWLAVFVAIAIAGILLAAHFSRPYN